MLGHGALLSLVPAIKTRKWIRQSGLLFALIPSLFAQSSPCDLNGDGVVNVADVQIAVNEVLGLSACTMNLDGTGACDVADVQRVITAALGGACVVTPPTTSTTITLPIEVMGSNGVTAPVSFSIPAASAPLLSGAQTLSLQIHGLKYQTQASLRVNSSAWIPINSSTVTLQGLGGAYGGIGGGFHTLSMTLSLPAGTVGAGNNTVTFMFNGTDGVTSGFRVLALNVVGSDGSSLLPSSTFVWDDPDNWQPPSTLSSDIAAGETLYTTAALTVPTSSGGTAAIRAHCSDCHTQDGRDLKYFNYSNNSIQIRSKFHGLTAQQGNQIASYIRSLNVPNPGRPWNPPYQPGAGLDAQPVANWAAGAGLAAVLDSDAAMQPFLMPGGSTAGWAASQYLNTRQVPLAMQLPDWNSWLPAVHPMDAFGSSFTSSGMYNDYLKLRSELQPNNSAAYNSALSDFGQWFVDTDTDFLGSLENNADWDANNLRTTVYSAALWRLVKFFELNQEFGLEAMPQVPFGSKANVRGWFGNAPFNTSPNMLHIPAGTGLGNGSAVVKSYLSLIWYQLQAVLNDGQGKEVGSSPIDFPYVFGFVQDLSQKSNNSPEAMVVFMWYVKSLQEETLTGVGPQQGSFGWQPMYTIPSFLVYGNMQPLWPAGSSATEAAFLQGYLAAWFTQVASYTPQQYYAGGWANASDNPATLNVETTFGGALWYMLPRLRYYGVNAALTQQVGNWAATVWPHGNWALNNSATCNAGAGQCTSD